MCSNSLDYECNANGLKIVINNHIIYWSMQIHANSLIAPSPRIMHLHVKGRNLSMCNRGLQRDKTNLEQQYL